MFGPFNRPAFLPQVRIRPSLGCPECGGFDEIGIRATGGRVMRPNESRTRNDFILFYMDEEIRDAIEVRTGLRPARPFETKTSFCNPTPGVVPALGDFVDPETGLVCFLEFPDDWGMAYLDFLLQRNIGEAPLPENAVPYDSVGTPPYWGEWGVHVGDGVIGDCGKVGPFDTIDEAFSAAADAAIEHGATALPLDGFAQVKDSRGRGVGPIT